MKRACAEADGTAFPGGYAERKSNRRSCPSHRDRVEGHDAGCLSGVLRRPGAMADPRSCHARHSSRPIDASCGADGLWQDGGCGYTSYQRHVSFRRKRLSTLYVAPTKALANDIFERLDSYLGNRSPGCVTRYTGDRHDFQDPEGLFCLIVTPEALGCSSWCARRRWQACGL